LWESGKDQGGFDGKMTEGTAVGSLMDAGWKVPGMRELLGELEMLRRFKWQLQSLVSLVAAGVAKQRIFISSWLGYFLF
jgi:hypothetical protein